MFQKYIVIVQKVEVAYDWIQCQNLKTYRKHTFYLTAVCMYECRCLYGVCVGVVMQASIIVLHFSRSSALRKPHKKWGVNSATFPLAYYHLQCQCCWFHASHESKHCAGISSCPSPYEALLRSEIWTHPSRYSGNSRCVDLIGNPVMIGLKSSLRS